MLPALTAEMFASGGRSQTFCPLCARMETRRNRCATMPPTSTQLPRPHADQNKAELALLAMLTLSAMFCLGQAAITAIELTSQWPMFRAWVAQMLG